VVAEDLAPAVGLGRPVLEGAVEVGLRPVSGACPYDSVRCSASWTAFPLVQVYWTGVGRWQQRWQRWQWMRQPDCVFGCMKSQTAEAGWTPPAAATWVHATGQEVYETVYHVRGFGRKENHGMACYDGAVWRCGGTGSFVATTQEWPWRPR